MTNVTTTPVEQVFLILVGDVLVGQDLAQTIADDRPHARVIIAASLDSAATVLRDEAAVEIAFIEAQPLALQGSALAPILADRGAQIVLLGLWSEDAPPVPNWKTLPFPFTTDDVRVTLTTR